MFNFFKKKKNKVSLNSVKIPDFGWNTISEDRSVKKWMNPEQTALLSLHFFDKEPDLPTVKDLNFLKKFYRNIAVSSKGGIIEVDLLQIHNVLSVKTLIKIPKQDRGMIYLSSLTIPFENCSFVVKIQANEADITGIRDAVIADKLLKTGEITAGKDQFENWFSDPYDTLFKQGTLMNQSEKEIYDHEFPEHPLTVARALTHLIAKEIHFQAEIQELSSFKK